MRITEAAQRLGTSPRMLRFGDDDLAAVAHALRIEQRYDISPAALAFGLKVLTEPGVRADVAELGRRLGRWTSSRNGRGGCCGCRPAGSQSAGARVPGSQPAGARVPRRPAVKT